MRNFEERIAEIYRRSEKILQQRRKRRKHILMVCIPLVLCVTVLGALSMPSMMPKGDAAPENMLADTNGIYTAMVMKVEVTGEDLDLSYTCREDVLKISACLRACAVEPPSGSTLTDMEDGSDQVGSSTNISASLGIAQNIGHTITLIMEDGSKTKFLLADRLLKDQQTGDVYLLSQDQLFELKDLLGIS